METTVNFSFNFKIYYFLYIYVKSFYMAASASEQDEANPVF